MTVVIQRRSPLSATAFTELPKTLERVLHNRGLEPADLDTSLAHLLPPNLLGLDKAVERLIEARSSQQHVVIVGDFDCDGATSVALAITALREAGFVNVDYLVPNRFDYGYGLTPPIVELCQQQGAALIVTVDNGISSIEGVEAANAMGIDVIVTDHHLAGSQLPAAKAIVNPNQPGCPFKSKALAGVGVMFYVLIALRAKLREQGAGDIALASYLDLVALGTVADVVPLDRNNRILVDQGIRRMRAGALRPGIDAILKASGKSLSSLTSRDLGFSVGPKINAAGRLDDISMGIRCLTASSFSEAMQIAEQLVSLNDQRRQVEQAMRDQAEQLLADLDLTTLPSVITLFDERFHEGVIGILASRIKERYHRPTIVFAPTGDGLQVKGSARSIEGIHIRDLLDATATANPSVLNKFGGHAMAAGMSLDKAQLASLATALNNTFDSLFSEHQWQQRLQSDGELDEHSMMSVAVVKQMNQLVPWGQGCPAPTFDGRFELIDQRIVGSKHLKMRVRPEASTITFDAICFNVDLAEWPAQSRWVELFYSPDINEWRGQQSVQLLVSHLTAC